MFPKIFEQLKFILTLSIWGILSFFAIIFILILLVIFLVFYYLIRKKPRIEKKSYKESGFKRKEY